MASNAEEICNLALFYTGHNRFINNLLTDTSIEAQHCRRIYDMHRRALLTTADWGFAKAIEAATLTANTPTNGWAYEYDYPNGCLLLRGFARFNKLQKKIPFTTGTVLNVSTGAEKRVIWTDEADDPRLYYTRDTKLTSMFTPTFDQAFAYRMGMDLVTPLAQDKAIKKDLNNMFIFYINEAQRLGEIEAQDDEEQDAEWIRDR